jgi:hypothetical protein
MRHRCHFTVTGLPVSPSRDSFAHGQILSPLGQRPLFVSAPYRNIHKYNTNKWQFDMLLLFITCILEDTPGIPSVILGSLHSSTFCADAALDSVPPRALLVCCSCTTMFIT